MERSPEKQDSSLPLTGCRRSCCRPLARRPGRLLLQCPPPAALVVGLAVPPGRFHRRRRSRHQGFPRPRPRPPADGS